MAREALFMRAEGEGGRINDCSERRNTFFCLTRRSSPEHNEVSVRKQMSSTRLQQIRSADYAMTHGRSTGRARPGHATGGVEWAAGRVSSTRVDAWKHQMLGAAVAAVAEATSGGRCARVGEGRAGANQREGRSTEDISRMAEGQSAFISAESRPECPSPR